MKRTLNGHPLYRISVIVNYVASGNPQNKNAAAFRSFIDTC